MLQQTVEEWRESKTKTTQNRENLLRHLQRNGGKIFAVGSWIMSHITNDELREAQSSLRRQQSLKWWRNSQPFVKSEDSLPCSLEPALAHSTSWRTTPYRLSVPAYSIYSQIPSTSGGRLTICNLWAAACCGERPSSRGGSWLDNSVYTRASCYSWWTPNQVLVHRLLICDGYLAINTSKIIQFITRHIKFTQIILIKT
jgi:hypothetical protein